MICVSTVDFVFCEVQFRPYLTKYIRKCDKITGKLLTLFTTDYITMCHLCSLNKAILNDHQEIPNVQTVSNTWALITIDNIPRARRSMRERNRLNKNHGVKKF